MFPPSSALLRKQLQCPHLTLLCWRPVLIGGTYLPLPMRDYRKQKKHMKKYPHKEWHPQCSPKFFMWVAPSPSFSRRRGPQIKNFRVGSEMGDGGCGSLCLCASFGLEIRALTTFQRVLGSCRSGLKPSRCVGVFWHTIHTKAITSPFLPRIYLLFSRKLHSFR